MEKILVDIRNTRLQDIFKKDLVNVNELINKILDMQVEIDVLKEQNE